MPSAGLIKAAPSCCHRNGPARPLAPPSAGCPNHTNQRREHSCGSGRSSRPGEHVNNHQLLFNRTWVEKIISQNVNISNYAHSPSVLSSQFFPVFFLRCHSLTRERSIYSTIMSTPCMTLWCEYQRCSWELHTAAVVLLGTLVIPKSHTLRQNERRFITAIY